MTRILRLPEVLQFTGLSRSTIYNYIRDGIWPKPIRAGVRAVGWPIEEAEAVIKARTTGKTIEEIYQLVQKIMEDRSVSKTADQS